MSWGTSPPGAREFPSAGMRSLLRPLSCQRAPGRSFCSSARGLEPSGGHRRLPAAAAAGGTGPAGAAAGRARGAPGALGITPRLLSLPYSPLPPSPSHTGEGEETGATLSNILCPAAVPARPSSLCLDAAAAPGALLEALGGANPGREQRTAGLNPFPTALTPSRPL